VLDGSITASTKLTDMTDAVVVHRMDDGPRLVLEEPQLLAHDFFRLDASSVGPMAFDARAGLGDPNRITAEDLRAINQTMRARARHSAWEAEFGAAEPLPWLAAINLDWDLIATDDATWAASDCTHMIAIAVEKSTGRYRGNSVATKVLHVKRPMVFPILDSLALEQIGATNQPVAAILDHFRAVGRENLDQLRAAQAFLARQEITRSLVRVLDGLLWASHPGAGLMPKLGAWERTVRRRG
jgi:Family of unknown function (DUF6308)